MAGLDQLTISRVLGSTFRHVPRNRFSGFSAVSSVATVLAARPTAPPRLAPDPERDGKIVSAFEQIHQGFALDRMLADPALTVRFINRCNKLGVIEPPAAICRRLLRIRKEGELHVRTVKVRENRDNKPFLIPAELAFAKLSYHHDASYDDLLADQKLGTAFDALASKLGRGKGEPVDYRLAALHLRKNVRSRRSSDAQKLAKIHLSDVEQKWHLLGPLSNVVPESMPQTSGILSLSEPNRHLFLTYSPDVRAGIAFFKDQEVLAAIGNRFWTPSPDNISVCVMNPQGVQEHDLRLYELKYLEAYRPIFNMLPTSLAA